MSDDAPTAKGGGSGKKILLVLVALVVGYVGKRFGLDGNDAPARPERNEPAAERPAPKSERNDPKPEESPRPPPRRDAPPRSRSAPSRAEGDGGAGAVARLREAGRSGVMVTVKALVTAILPPDRDGKPHQRFIIKLSDGKTLLVAHNLTLAKKVPLSRHDEVEIKGQYEWNEKGGILHWTHHDPAKRHEEGWIRHEGRVYQ